MVLEASELENIGYIGGKLLRLDLLTTFICLLDIHKSLYFLSEYVIVRWDFDNLFHWINIRLCQV